MKRSLGPNPRFVQPSLLQHALYNPLWTLHRDWMVYMFKPQVIGSNPWFVQSSLLRHALHDSLWTLHRHWMAMMFKVEGALLPTSF
jgi:hypothetical protein